MNTFGFRTTGPVASGVKYSLEAALQDGKVGRGGPERLRLGRQPQPPLDYGR